MKYKNGIVMGTWILIYSVYAIVSNNTIRQNIGWIYYCALVISIIQVICSVRYHKQYRNIIKFCFLLEGIYYIGAEIALMSESIYLSEKLIGLLVGIGMLTFILVSIKNIDAIQSV